MILPSLPIISPSIASASEGGSNNTDETIIVLAATIRALSDLLPTGYTRPWSLAELSEVAELEHADILATIHARLPRGSHMDRWDSLRDLLREAELTPPGGWTATALSELAGIPLDTISDLTGRAIRNARAALAHQGIHNRRDFTADL